MCLVGVAYAGCDHVFAMTALALSLGTQGCTTAGFALNHIDIAPPFAGHTLVMLLLSCLDLTCVTLCVRAA